MINQQMKILVEQKRSIDPNYGEGVQNNWDKMIEVLTFDLKETIAYLDSAPEEEIFFASEVWEDISAFWQSKELLEAMERCKERLPGIAKQLELEISFAKKVMKQ